MKLMKMAAVHIIPSQVRHCAVTSKIIINFGRMLSEHVAQLTLGNEAEKVYAVFIQVYCRILAVQHAQKAFGQN